MTNALSGEIARVNQLSRAMIDEYVAWRDKIAYGEMTHAMYIDMLDFVNFRMETADSCLLLINNRRIGDSLGLSRSLFENYLLLMLMCRGSRFFKLEDLSSLTEGEFKARLKETQDKFRRLQEDGKTPCLSVERYPRAKRHLMYVFEGLHGQDEPDFLIPVHFFHFREFYPETMRLKDENYFQYFEPSPETKKADRGYRQEAASRYRHYLSYDALLQCLQINSMADLTRIEAHYTFLGKFLHPTHNAARDLHEGHNVYSGTTAIGMDQEYSEVAVLLASLYACYIVAGLLDEVADLFERAPSRYMADPGTTGLRSLTARVPVQLPYFWFLFNDPPLYDRYNYCSYHATDEELKEWGGYKGVPHERVPFDQHIYSRLKNALGGWSNMRCGVYESPIA